ncbi:DUF4382 domain-containing protein [Thermoproteota archaeon]
MAYDRKKVMTYGAIGIIIALIVIMFIPVNEQVNVNPYVTLEQIPEYGLQYIKVSEEQADLTHIYLTIHTIEAQLPSGEWVQISNTETQWDLIQETQKTLEINTDALSPGKYSKIRFYIAADLDKSNATLSDNQIISLSLQDNPFVVEITETEIDEGVDELSLTLTIGPGIVSNQMLPGYHIAIATSRLGGMISSL